MINDIGNITLNITQSVAPLRQISNLHIICTAT